LAHTLNLWRTTAASVKVVLRAWRRSVWDVRPVDGEGIPIGWKKLNVVAENETCYLGQNARPGEDGHQREIGPWTVAAHPARPIARDGPMHRTAPAGAKTLTARILVETKCDQGRRAQRESELPDEACDNDARQPNTERAHQSVQISTGPAGPPIGAEFLTGRRLVSARLCYA
jgi:hypothetical protein